ncbi:MAG: hypothetical protein J0H09_09985 [Burkholderiales bacterium]|nr:hypothetical protein [Burkholderiales bacterium]
MKKRMPGRRRSDAAQEQKVDLKSRHGAREGAELLPHERDQNPAVVDKAAVPDPAIRQAAEDLEAGLQDTDQRAEVVRNFERGPSRLPPRR